MSADRPPSTPSSNDQPTGPLIPSWVWWVVFAVLLAWNAVTFLVPRGPATISLSYTDFLTQIESGNVAKVTISGQSVNGQLKKAIPVPGATPVPASTPGQKTAPPASDQFSTTIPALNDPTLLPLLEKQGVQITAVETSNGSWVLDLLSNALPILLLVGLMLYIGRQMQRGQQSALGFGRSKARLYQGE